MTKQEQNIISTWNSQADQYNQWDMLSEEEKKELLTQRRRTEMPEIRELLITATGCHDCELKMDITPLCSSVKKYLCFFLALTPYPFNNYTSSDVTQDVIKKRFNAYCQLPPKKDGDNE